MPQFQYIPLLILLVLIPLMIVMYVTARKKKKNSLQKIGDPELVKSLMGEYSSKSFFRKFLLLTAAMLMLVLALANLRIATGSEKVNRTGIDIMIALDVSKSMLAQDIRPTRLDRAKQLLSRLTDRLANDRIGIVIFAGKSYLQMPLTGDLAAAKMYISSASTESVPTQGTVIGDALKMCYASFNVKEKKYKAVVLITDGEDHDENAVKIAKQMAAEGIVINTIGIGTVNGAPIPDAATGQMKTDAEGNTVVSKLNEGELREVAQNGNGIYQLYSTTEEVVARLSAQLASMDQRAVTEDSLVNYKNFFQVFLGIAFIFLLIEIWMSEMKTKKTNGFKVTATAAIFILCGNTAFAQSEKATIKQGNEAYKKADYPAASQSYEKVIAKNPENATAQYNLGNALYKLEKKEEAIAAYEKAATKLTKPVEKSNASYNKGVVLQNDKKLPECIEAYKNALKLDPNNEDARQNLQKALQQQKKQQQEQKENEKKNKNKQPEQDKNKDQQQPKPKPSKLTKKEAEEKLKALMEKEKNLQDKLRRVGAAAPDKPEKDW